MAKTNRPLRVLVHPSLMGTYAVKDLVAKQNEVHTEPTGSVWDYDMVLGPTVWRTIPDFDQGIDMAIKAARASKYPSKKKGDAE